MDKMRQVRFPLGLWPRPRWGAYSAPQTLAVFKGPTSKGREGYKEGRRREGGGKGKKKGKGRAGEMKGRGRK